MPQWDVTSITTGLNEMWQVELNALMTSRPTCLNEMCHQKRMPQWNVPSRNNHSNESSQWSHISQIMPDNGCLKGPAKRWLTLSSCQKHNHPKSDGTQWEDKSLQHCCVLLCKNHESWTNTQKGQYVMLDTCGKQKDMCH
jgi:hypothetical protein